MGCQNTELLKFAIENGMIDEVLVQDMIEMQNLRCNGVSPTVAAALLGHTERVNEENYTYDVSTIDEKMSIVKKAGRIS